MNYSTATATATATTTTTATGLTHGEGQKEGSESGSLSNQGENESESDSGASGKDLTQSGNSTTESGKTHSADEVRREIRRAVAARQGGKGSDESRRTSSVSKIPVTREDLKGMMKEVLLEMNRSPEIEKLPGNASETPRAFHISSC